MMTYEFHSVCQWKSSGSGRNTGNDSNIEQCRFHDAYRGWRCKDSPTLQINDPFIPYGPGTMQKEFHHQTLHSHGLGVELLDAWTSGNNTEQHEKHVRLIFTMVLLRFRHASRVLPAAPSPRSRSKSSPSWTLLLSWVPIVARKGRATHMTDSSLGPVTIQNSRFLELKVLTLLRKLTRNRLEQPILSSLHMRVMRVQFLFLKSSPSVKLATRHQQHQTREHLRTLPTSLCDVLQILRHVDNGTKRLNHGTRAQISATDQGRLAIKTQT